ncbi:MAG TPA: isoprenylcysteine carboxylmethyltransferase family protein [Terracidiphilus sp.]|nr:isoprenylcysteine carboxylmethyltransferase family protein [Terracidiphilus sp.]
MLLGRIWEFLLWGWVGLEVVIAIATRTRRSEGRAHDRGTQLLIWVVIFLSFYASGWAATPGLEMPFAHHALRVTAIVLMVLGLVVRIVAIVTLGKAFSANVAIRSTQTLQRSGLYSVVRHPSYLGMEIIFLAAGVWGHNWGSLAVMIVLPTLSVLYRIHMEEIALRSAFGAEYEDYARTTKRLIPGVY